MKTIDFLPQKYHDKSARQRAGVWRLLVVALLGGAVGAASVAQFLHRRSIQRQLDELQPQYADAQAKAATLAQLQTELTRETAAATLYAYLQTPWPRTQLVSAVMVPVGKQLRIEQFHLVETATQKAKPTSTENPEAAPALDSMSPATRDLTAVRAEVATRTTTTEIIGTSSQAGAIHTYIEQLETSPLVARAQLVRLENVTVKDQPRQLRFTAQVTIRGPRGWVESAPETAQPAAEALTQSTVPTP
jgi:hypothetical protein